MELAADEEQPYERQSGAVGIIIAKIALLVVLSVGMVIFLGYGWLFSVVLIGWFLFATR
jgi:hypothetical protein